jgi:hypothetical protein
VQDLGDAAHARAAHADEVDVLDGVFHALAPARNACFVGTRRFATKWEMCLMACFIVV